ncbi:solute carrier family 44 protein member 2 [Trypanosoma theileri]|uniref:Choline transporter-like protein n=1 Tax=Trypanosoma theileri TaxID=67003 RepID=A0A1X0NJ13_9TRYP|nr:solute carrier family 44 protein member 2 [Trypanosoma theileri]ORC84179.1 solute carrier family 44 protein member 2 [Trypanosoma theileri]
MGCCCCCVKTTRDEPETYEKRRNCTDIFFALLFIAMLACFVALGVIAFDKGDVRSIVYGHDYLGHYCGEGEAPPDFESKIPETAMFQSKKWEENKFVWYPLPLAINYSSVFSHLSRYLNLGVCVKTCPETDVEALKLLAQGGNATHPTLLEKIRVFSYGTTAANGETVQAASQMYAVYDSSELIRKCLPKLTQPEEVRDIISDPFLQKAYTFAMQGAHEVQNSWRVFIIEAAICVALCFVFIVLMRYMVDLLVWLVILCLFFILAGGGAICYFLYHTRGESTYLPVSGISDYALLFLVFAIILWVLSLVYLFIILALCSKVRLVCAVIKISSRVLASVPSLLIVPIVIGVLILVVLTWSVAVGMALYSARKSDSKLSLVPVTDGLKFSDETVVVINNTKFYSVASRVLETDHIFEYLAVADLFAFLWTMGFLSAFSFTVVAFVSVFWYFSSLHNSEKAVPLFGVCRAVCWTLVYHTGTIALGSLIIAIIQTIRFLLSYFAKKAKAAMGDNQLFKCVFYCMKCFVACFEKVLSVINKNAYVMMCITSNGFCLSACSAVSMILTYAVELLFLGWLLGVVIFFGKLFVVGSCCVSAYFLCTVESLAPDVEVKFMPVLVVGVMAYFMCTVFFNVYNSAADALLVCYCYDRKMNESNGLYYVPYELEHQLKDYSQREKLREFNAMQAAAHQD